MSLSFDTATLSEARDAIGRHLDALPGPTDAFFEQHVRDSTHYRISISGALAGHAAIHGGNLITQFSLERAQLRFGQDAFRSLRKLESVSAALVPTCDEVFLSHALDEQRQVVQQAYLFEAPLGVDLADQARGCSLKRATKADADVIRERSGEFFDAIDARIDRGELFTTRRDGECVGFGILERSPFRKGVASVGMFTIEAFRFTGVGTATVALLVQECAKLRLQPVAGCWYYNAASKHTLERAGMTTRTRLLRVTY